MRFAVVVASLMAMWTVPAWGQQWLPRCSGSLTDEQVRASVASARMTRKEMPPAPKRYESTIRRQGCHYIYLEYPQPAQLHSARIFTLNDKARVVDVDGGSDLGSKEAEHCPVALLSQEQLRSFVARERARGTGMPEPFEQATVSVMRQRCMYFYMERPVPAIPNRYHAFVIDPYGELMRVRIGEPARCSGPGSDGGKP
jgi:hypothetical protein